MSNSPVRVIVLNVIPHPSEPTGAVVMLGNEGIQPFPIMIGLLEAQAIALPLQGLKPPRPLTHDLMVSLLAETGYQLDHILISDLRDNTFIAQLHLRHTDGTEKTIDARPSDSIALAVRVGCPILVDAAVYAKVTVKSPEEFRQAELERALAAIHSGDPDKLPQA